MASCPWDLIYIRVEVPILWNFFLYGVVFLDIRSQSLVWRSHNHSLNPLINPTSIHSSKLIILSKVFSTLTSY